VSAWRAQAAPGWVAPAPAGLWWRGPAGAVQAAAAFAWLSYAATLLASAPPSAEASRSIWWCMPGMSLGGSRTPSPMEAALQGVPMWSLMAVAMTLPAAVPAAQHVAINSFRRRQWRAVGVFLTVYVTLWLVFGVLAMSGLALLHQGASHAVLVGSLALAASWELTPLKRRALNRCHRSAPLAPRGPSATASVLRFGWINGSGCVASCWPAMLVMLATPAARLASAALLTVLMSYGKLTRRPRKATRRTAAVFGAAASGLAAGLLLT
jgi:predicted metal-binding membrane protein